MVRPAILTARVVVYSSVATVEMVPSRAPPPERVPVVGRLQRGVGVNKRARVARVVFAGERQIIVERLAVDGLPLRPRLRDGRDALPGRDVHEVDARPSVSGEADDLAEGNVLREVVVDEVDELASGAPLACQLLEHELHDVVVLGVDDHDPAFARDLRHCCPEVAVVDSWGRVAASEGGVDLEAGRPPPNHVADLLQGLEGEGAGQRAVEAEVDVGVSLEALDALVQRLQRQPSGTLDREIDHGGRATEGGRPRGGLRRLRLESLLLGPQRGDGPCDVGVGLDAAGDGDEAGGVDGAPGLFGERARLGHRDYPLAPDRDVELRDALRRDDPRCSHDQVEHD